MPQHTLAHDCTAHKGATNYMQSQCHDVVQVESMGEALLVVGAPNGWGPHPLTSEQMAAVMQELTAEMDRVGADVTELRRRGSTSTVKGKPLFLQPIAT